MEEKQLRLFKIRDLRKKDQFKIDDIYLNGYARVCGKDATLVYTSLCRHAEFHSQEAFPSQEKIAYEHKISVRTVKRGIKKLIDYKIVIAEQERVKGKFTNYIYTLLDKSEWKKLPPRDKRDLRLNHRHQTVGRLTADGVEPTKDYKEQRITNIKDNKQVLQHKSVAGKEINDLIDKFKEVNPCYERLFSNKSQRQALERLVKKFGPEKIKRLLNILPQIYGKPYAPRITTPYLLEQKLGDLFAYLKERSEIKTNFIDLTKI